MHHLQRFLFHRSSEDREERERKKREGERKRKQARGRENDQERENKKDEVRRAGPTYLIVVTRPKCPKFQQVLSLESLLYFLLPSRFSPPFFFLTRSLLRSSVSYAMSTPRNFPWRHFVTTSIQREKEKRETDQAISGLFFLSPFSVTWAIIRCATPSSSSKFERFHKLSSKQKSALSCATTTYNTLRTARSVWDRYVPLAFPRAFLVSFLLPSFSLCFFWSRSACRFLPPRPPPAPDLLPGHALRILCT